MIGNSAMPRFALAALLLLPVSAMALPPGLAVDELVSTTTTVTGEPITLPEHPQLKVSKYTIAPGAKLPVHKHPAQRYAYILSGEIDVTFPDADKHFHSKPGDFIVEGMDQWHYGINKGKAPVVLLVIDQMPEAAKTNTVLKDAQ